jgi:hypothetical protein
MRFNRGARFRAALKKRFEKPDPCREIERNFRAFQMASKLSAKNMPQTTRDTLRQAGTIYFG